jgi:hypothetical protein
MPKYLRLISPVALAVLVYVPVLVQILDHALKFSFMPASCGKALQFCKFQDNVSIYLWERGTYIYNIPLYASSLVSTKWLDTRVIRSSYALDFSLGLGKRSEMRLMFCNSWNSSAVQ